jgi:predicted MFS family arabinose efflux permease
MAAMTMTTPTTPAAPAIRRPRLVSAPLVAVFLADFGALTGFYLLLPVVPTYAAAAGGGVGAGLSTAVLMISTVLAEFALPRLVARFGYRTVLAVGLVLVGAPALALPVSAGLPLVLTVCLLRGLGLAVIFVVCGALSAMLVPTERRGEGLGVFGVVASVPAVIGMPLGVWLAGEVGYAPVFALAAITALSGLAVIRRLPGRTSSPEAPLRMAAGLRTPALLRPSLAFAATATAAGVIATFLPAAMPAGPGVALALLAHTVATTVSRWWAGRFSDRHGATRLLAPSVVVTAGGMVTLVLVAHPVAAVAGLVAVGAGFGVAQNVSMSMMLDRVPTSGYGTVSALWSVAYDTGYGLGAAAIGLLAAQTGYPVAFAVNGLVILAVAAAGWLTRVRSR